MKQEVLFQERMWFHTDTGFLKASEKNKLNHLLQRPMLKTLRPLLPDCLWSSLVWNTGIKTEIVRMRVFGEESTVSSLIYGWSWPAHLHPNRVLEKQLERSSGYFSKFPVFLTVGPHLTYLSGLTPFHIKIRKSPWTKGLRHQYEWLLILAIASYHSYSISGIPRNCGKLEGNLGSVPIPCQSLWWTPKGQIWALGETLAAFPPTFHLCQLSAPFLQAPTPSPSGTDTWLKGTVLQASWCTSWLLMGRMIPWEAGPILNTKWCQNLLASSRRGDFSICIPSFGWARARVPGGKCSLTESRGGRTCCSGFFQNLPNLDSIFSLCLWPSPAPIRCGTATKRSGFSSASSWWPTGSSLWLLSGSLGETGVWLWWPSWCCCAAFPRGRSTSSRRKRRHMLWGPKLLSDSQMVRSKGKVHSLQEQTRRSYI